MERNRLNQLLVRTNRLETYRSAKVPETKQRNRTKYNPDFECFAVHAVSLCSGTAPCNKQDTQMQTEFAQQLIPGNVLPE
jgi:hypothetical protein